MISMDKQYRTRDGREVRIYAVDGVDGASVHGAYRCINAWHVCWWTEAGFSFGPGVTDSRDLIEVKPKITRTYWLAHARAGGVSQICGSVDQARALLSPNSTYLLAITGPHTIEFTEGDGL